MTDSRLQQLKRAWETSGSPADEAALLRERVRVGELTQERLELAACLGHVGLPQGSTFSLLKALPAHEGAARNWCAAFARHFGSAAALRLCIPIARASLRDWRAFATDDPRPRLAIESAEAWLICPYEHHRAQCEDAANAADQAGNTAADVEEHNEHAVGAGDAACDAEACARIPSGAEWFYDVVGNRARAGICPPGFFSTWLSLMPLLRDEVVPWALGHADPVKARVEARNGSAASG